MGKIKGAKIKDAAVFCDGQARGQRRGSSIWRKVKGWDGPDGRGYRVGLCRLGAAREQLIGGDWWAGHRSDGQAVWDSGARIGQGY